MHILLVEDNEWDIRLTQEAFRESAIASEISVARNGQEALDFVFRTGRFGVITEPDLILLDINLPLINGDEVLRIIKADDRVKHIPVVMLTTSSSQEDIRKAYQNHANAYITKPGDILEFMDAVAALIKFWAQIVRLPN